MSPTVRLVLLCAVTMVLTSADPLCDPETQYLHNGECCQLCKPGTSMASMECRNPTCKDCEDNEYMDKYNKEEMCKRQPYCDPNSNFVRPESTSRTQRHQCQCQRGFHCASSSCTTCVPHTECDRGHGATTIGDQTHDTVCEKCPKNTFSDEKSWSGICKEKTPCKDGTQPKDDSSDSDNKCEPIPTNVGLVLGVIVIVVFLVAAAVFLIRRHKHRCKGKHGHKPLKIPKIETDAGDCDGGRDEEKGPPLITTPEDSADVCRPTEETAGVVLTVNGQVLSQDQKEYVVSQPETQPSTSSF